MLLLKLFFSGQDELFSLNIFGAEVVGHRDGLREGLLIGTRIIGAVSIVAVLGFSTPFTEFMAGLSWFRVPKGFIEILMFAYRYIFVLFEDAQVIYQAQKNRLGYSNVRRGLSSFGTLAGSLTIKAFDHSQSTTVAMVQRGYDGAMPMLMHKPFKSSELFAISALAPGHGSRMEDVDRVQKTGDSGQTADVRLSVDIDIFAYADGTQALGGIALEVRKGEFVGILGSNGSGKTTLLKVMDGLIKEYKGTVLLDGADVRKLSPKQIYQKVGLVFQNPDDQLFAPTVHEDVAFGPLNMGFGTG